MVAVVVAVGVVVAVAVGVAVVVAVVVGVGVAVVVGVGVAVVVVVAVVVGVGVAVVVGVAVAVGVTMITRERLLELAEKVYLVGGRIPIEGRYFKALEAFAALVLAEDKAGIVAYGDYIDLQRENARLRAAMVELTRLDPPESILANVRVVIYGNDARDFALRVLTPNVQGKGPA